MATYSLYGLTLRSNQPLPMLTPAPTHAPDIEIEFQRTDRQMARDGARLRHALPYCNAAGESLLQIWQLSGDAGYWIRSSIGEEWAEYQIATDGRRVEVFVRPATPLADLTPPLCGLVLPLLLRLHGVTCLHASAVVIAGAVIAFTGPAETGKSTMLTALLQRGGDFFSDELVPLHLTPGGVATCGGFPQVGLWPDSMRALLGAQADLPYLWQGSPTRPDKRIFAPARRPDSAGAGPLPLGAVYLLAPRGTDAGARVHIAGLSLREAVAQLVPHTTGRALASAADLAADLTHLTHLARTVPVRLVERPDDLAQLDAVAVAIQEDFARLATTHPGLSAEDSIS